ncbi:putative N-acetylmannosamine-6-phosphate 2-epimerase [Paraburkholderia humisilvae]|uniref:N-acylglucosamine-6-phosphate 2-epimerase n=1 Tax=Paraburkholderia humisilvae TaxID=627669 RepID=A0A6J5F9S4_9BURK|nr:putative N-acetylmannosamine-6-phosphate 2-epimerase [Paraburkholderia humisilvae]CAB3774551.1 Putative N-acetylmannosamine-6-phosphate 2-epimerase [Paraburkholderia humisilvae]
MNPLFSRLHRKLVVSCQALADEPLFGHMDVVARAAAEGGAAGVLTNGYAEIAQVKAAVDLPVIGVISQRYPDAEIALTATLSEIDTIWRAGADIAGLEATKRRRPNNDTLDAFYLRIRARYPSLLLMAEVATADEALHAQALGFDCISSAAFGYTPETSGRKLPDNDFAAFRALRSVVTRCPLVGEGRIETPSQAAQVLHCGADFVVVGSAITRPQTITARFVHAMHET